MNDPAPRRATYEDILKLPEGVRGELINGELHTQPRPAPDHAFIETALSGDLFNPFVRGQGGPGGWWIVMEPEIHLQGDVLVPDLAGWKKSRLPQLPDAANFSLSPDWVCEILSPSTRRKDRMIKLPAYALHGVEWCWLADPLAREIEVLRLASRTWTFAGVFGDGPARVPPFEAVEFDLSLVWPPVQGE